MKLGGFGVPSYTADGELFFGVDSPLGPVLEMDDVMRDALIRELAR